MPGITYDLDQTPMHELELNPSSDWRQRLGAIMDGATMQRLVTLLIIINAVILGLQTSPSIMADWGTPLLILDTFILTCFVIELVLRFTARGIGLLRDPWAVFDCLVVGIALVPASGPFAVLRALRVLRVLRLVSINPSMRKVVQALLDHFLAVIQRLTQLQAEVFRVVVQIVLDAPAKCILLLLGAVDLAFAGPGSDLRQ